MIANVVMIEQTPVDTLMAEITNEIKDTIEIKDTNTDYIMKYFTMTEMTNSVTAKKRGIDNTPNDTIKAHLTELVENLLDPLREAWGSPIKVTSGYRCTALNRAVGGSTTSAHNAGYAADMVPLNGKITEFKAFVKKWLKDNNKAFDQYINEFSGSSQWVHLAIKNREGKQRKQYMLYKGGKYSYEKN